MVGKFSGFMPFRLIKKVTQPLLIHMSLQAHAIDYMSVKTYNYTKQGLKYLCLNNFELKKLKRYKGCVS